MCSRFSFPIDVLQGALFDRFYQRNPHFYPDSPRGYLIAHGVGNIASEDGRGHCSGQKHGRTQPYQKGKQRYMDGIATWLIPVILRVPTYSWEYLVYATIDRLPTFAFPLANGSIFIRVGNYTSILSDCCPIAFIPRNIKQQIFYWSSTFHKITPDSLYCTLGFLTA